MDLVYFEAIKDKIIKRFETIEKCQSGKLRNQLFRSQMFRFIFILFKLIDYQRETCLHLICYFYSSLVANLFFFCLLP